jgi:hypothetical protein
LFSSFDKARNESRKQQLASKICAALKVHTRIEEEIFYPAFLEQARDEDMHHEAVVEHDGAKKRARAIWISLSWASGLPRARSSS